MGAVIIILSFIQIISIIIVFYCVNQIKSNKLKSKMEMEMKNDRGYVRVETIPTRYGEPISLTIGELEEIVKTAKGNGATNFSVSEGDGNGDYSTFFFYRYQNNEEYNAELQGRIDRGQRLMNEMKSNLIK